MQGWSVAEAKQRCEVEDLRPHLERGQLIGYARPDSPEGSKVMIPRSAWADLEMTEDDGAGLFHRSSKTEWHDLCVYPLLHATDAPELLHDRDLAEVLISSVVKDPEVAALGRRVMGSGRYRSVFAEGKAPGPESDPHWQLDFDAEGLANEFVRQIMWFPGDPLPRPSAAVSAAAVALVDRLGALRRLLSTGQIVATGTHRISGEVKPIHRAQWLRTNCAIHAFNGDLCETEGVKWTPIWTALILEHPKLPVPLAGERFHKIVGGLTKPRSPISTIAAGTHCKRWLEQLVKEHPYGKPDTKNAIFDEAKAKWRDLSRREFNNVWKSVTADVTRASWRSSGRPRKTPSPKI